MTFRRRYSAPPAPLAVLLAILAAGCAANLPLPDPSVTGGTVAASSTGQQRVHFHYVDPAARSVHLAGSFNNWSATADPLTGPDAQGRWSIEKPLGNGEHQYKFVVNGTEWKADPTCERSADDGYGGKNSVIAVGASAPAAPARAEGTAAGRAPRRTDAGWEFAFSAAGAQSVHVAGSFNSWSTTATPMTDADGDAVWTVTIPLPSGEHQYKLVVNGTEWKPDPANPETADDGYGGKNSVVRVP